LHTWGQNLSLHPHLHCNVPGGGITPAGRWKYAKNKGKPGCREARFLFPVKAFSKVFRAWFTEGLRERLELPAGFYYGLFIKDWVVYCKRLFYGPSQVVEYLGRYTHMIAISNHRIKRLEADLVVFSVKDYKHGGKKPLMRLSHQ